MRPQRLTLSEQNDALGSLSAWRIDDDRRTLRRSVQFASFAEAFGFMAEVALVAERLDHHPDWRNVYNRVEIALSTHDADGLTTLDLQLAAVIDRAVASRSA